MKVRDLLDKLLLANPEAEVRISINYDDGNGGNSLSSDVTDFYDWSKDSDPEVCLEGEYD